MSAPPGWHPQPDGRERWWDGQQWTDHFRDPVATPAPPYTGTPADGGYATPGPAGYGAPGGYGTPGAPGQPWPPPKQGMSSGAKGCLVAVVVVLLLAVIAAVVAGIFFVRGVGERVDDFSESFPVPTSSEFPDGLPTGGEQVTVTLGEGFELPDATVADGWRLGEEDGVGRRVEGMNATFAADRDLPVVFSLSFDGGAETVCTATPSEGAETVEVTCIPVFEDVADDARVTVTPTL